MNAAMQTNAVQTKAVETNRVQTNPVTDFDSLNLIEPVLQAVRESGYTVPSPIQAQMIPHMLAGKDVLGQAQTGTGKTAAFALPILSKIDTSSKALQVLVLAPTRELAMQVSDSFARYSTHLDGLRVVPIYGGKGYADQLFALKRGVHIVVGTPGRVMDHMRSGKLVLDNLTTLVLDEADEMLRMGFIDDVEWILERSPQKRQIALFSATMPRAIKQITQRYLVDPVEIVVKSQTATAALIRQRYWMASGMNKLDALTRILEQKHSDGVIVFARTKSGTTELAESLIARGFSAVALNGDIAQKQREQTISQLKSGRVDILVATDVAARGLDVERISHVINYDIPNDPESYIHRIGRTGRAGREGEAILFVSPREMRMLSVIERVTHQRIEKLELPTIAEINQIRLKNFTETVKAAIEKGGFEFFQEELTKLQQESGIDPLILAAALAKMAQGDKPFFLAERSERERGGDRDNVIDYADRNDRGPRRGRFNDRGPRDSRDGGSRDGAFRDRGPRREWRGDGERSFSRGPSSNDRPTNPRPAISTSDLPSRGAGERPVRSSARPDRSASSDFRPAAGADRRPPRGRARPEGRSRPSGPSRNAPRAR